MFPKINKYLLSFEVKKAILNLILEDLTFANSNFLTFVNFLNLVKFFNFFDLH